MSEPIVFISHSRFKEGGREALERTMPDAARQLQAAKPRTLVFLAFVGGDGTRLDIVHVFADAASMDLHLEGADERAARALEFIEPESYEIYGSPSDSSLAAMRRFADELGAPLSVHPGYLGGFLRVGSG
ncbi:MAG TPA: hypothetical protein VFK38_09750 [Candidatus Limnocylindrales bacterium]|nr:hypothetical protein [Candidatus Limnocylindrales bacterium]